MDILSRIKKRTLNVGFRKFVDTYCTTKDFPEKGVNFIDIFPIIKRRGLSEVSEVLKFNEDIVLIPEARGFLFANVVGWDKVIPLRKKGKLPGKLLEIKYKKEYGEDSLFFQKDAILKHLENLNWDKSNPVTVCFFDDVLATGGTAYAVSEFFNNLQLDGYTFKVVSNKFYIEIVKLQGRNILKRIKGLEVDSVYEY